MSNELLTCLKRIRDEMALLRELDKWPAAFRWKASHCNSSGLENEPRVIESSQSAPTIS